MTALLELCLHGDERGPMLEAFRAICGLTRDLHWGEGPAVVFGMSRSSADAVIMINVDEGHPVSVIPKMIDLYLNGADVVQAVRITLKDRKIYRDAGAAFFKIISRVITGVNTKEQNVPSHLNCSI